MQLCNESGPALPVFSTPTVSSTTGLTSSAKFWQGIQWLVLVTMWQAGPSRNLSAALTWTFLCNGISGYSLPSCCVSFSSFYNHTKPSSTTTSWLLGGIFSAFSTQPGPLFVSQCPSCSCGCPSNASGPHSTIVGKHFASFDGNLFNSNGSTYCNAPGTVTCC